MNLKIIVLSILLSILAYHVYGPAYKLDSVTFKERYGPWSVIAGASQGTGEAFARDIASRGVNVILLARREKEMGEVAQRIRNDYPNVEVRTVQADLSDSDAVIQKLEKASSDVEIGSIIYNAAWSNTGHFLNRTEQELKMAVGVNVQTLTILSSRYLNKFKEQKRGGFLIVSSVAGLYGAKYVATYASTKAFQIALAKGLWSEMSQYGVDVVCSIAGGIRTSGLSAVFDESEYPPGTQTAEEVALESISYMASRSGPLLIPGSTNRLINFFLMLLPSKISTQIIGDRIEATMLAEVEKK